MSLKNFYRLVEAHHLFPLFDCTAQLYYISWDSPELCLITKCSENYEVLATLKNDSSSHSKSSTVQNFWHSIHSTSKICKRYWLIHSSQQYSWPLDWNRVREQELTGGQQFHSWALRESWLLYWQVGINDCCLVVTGKKEAFSYGLSHST